MDSQDALISIAGDEQQPHCHSDSISEDKVSEDKVSEDEEDGQGSGMFAFSKARLSLFLKALVTVWSAHFPARCSNSSYLLCAFLTAGCLPI